MTQPAHATQTDQKAVIKICLILLVGHFVGGETCTGLRIG